MTDTLNSPAVPGSDVIKATDEKDACGDKTVQGGSQNDSTDFEAATLQGSHLTPPPAEQPTPRGGESEKDPNIVDWDGPDDPMNPMNWPIRKKWINVGVLSFLTVITPLGSSMFAPGIPSIMAEYHSTSPITAPFVLSIYILGFAFGPLVVAPLSELYGRVRLYSCGSVLFTIFTVGTALSNSLGMLMGFRFLMGLAGSVPLTIGSGSIADVMPVEMRGRAMSIWALGPMLGPAIGPLAGGFLVEAAGWRWVFWLLAIVGGVCILVTFAFLRESYAPVLLERKAARLAQQTGNQALHSGLEKGTAAEKFRRAIVRPLKLLLMTPIVTLMALYVALAYGITYLLYTTFSFVYSEKYGFSEGIAGLTFLPAGLGMMIGVLAFGHLSDAMVKKRQARGIEHVAELRLTPLMAVPSALLLPAGLFIYGWATDYAIHWIVPMVGVFLYTFGLMGVMMCIQNYLLDCYLRYAASCTAAITVLRSIAGALLPLGGLQMYDTLGLGWGNSLLGFIALAMVPMLMFFYHYGPRIRARFNPTL